MSKLSKALYSKNAGMTFYLPPNNFRFTEEWGRPTSTKANRYKLEATFSVSILIDDKVIIAQKTDAVAESVAKAKRMLLEEIFGEFRQDLYRLAHLVNTRNWAASSELIEKIVNDMYDPS